MMRTTRGYRGHSRLSPTQTASHAATQPRSRAAAQPRSRAAAQPRSRAATQPRSHAATQPRSRPQLHSRRRSQTALPTNQPLLINTQPACHTHWRRYAFMAAAKGCSGNSCCGNRIILAEWRRRPTTVIM